VGLAEVLALEGVKDGVSSHPNVKLPDSPHTVGEADGVLSVNTAPSEVEYPIVRLATCVERVDGAGGEIGALDEGELEAVLELTRTGA